MKLYKNTQVNVVIEIEKLCFHMNRNLLAFQADIM